MDRISATGTCVLCDRPLTPGGGLEPHIGFCPTCAAELGMIPAEDVLGLTARDLDLLPFGFVTVDENGIVEAFNAFESELSGLQAARVMGRSFFRQVAPCTAVQEFEGRYKAMVEKGEPGMDRFRYLFRFNSGERLVQITMTYLPDKKKGVLIVRNLDRA
jgi:photoactive yellow protein